MSVSQPADRRQILGAAQRLRLEAATAEVVSAFDARGVQSILLKGASIARWLYADGPPRTYSDCDLLVRPADHRVAMEVLSELGFEAHIDERAMPSWWVEHAMGWLRRHDGAAVDLHRTLAGVGADPERLWETLRADVETITLGGVAVKMLGIPGRSLHLALHAAQHGGAWGIKLEELQRALSLADEETWRSAARIAQRVEATGAFATGLRMVPEGRALAARLALAADTPVDVALRAGSAPAVALGFDQLARAGSPAARARILRHKVVPPPTFMRAWSPLARRGRAGLALAYAWRPLWLVLRAPAGLRAWRAAR